VYRAYPTRCAIRDFKGACRFEFVRGKGDYIWNDGDIVFPDKPQHMFDKSEYRTVFGPSFSSEANMYRVDTYGIRGAVRRVTAEREIARPGYHLELVRNQFSIPPALTRRWTHWFKQRLREQLDNVLDVATEKNKWCEAAHPKKVLRVNSRRDLLADGRIHHPTFLRQVDYKCKPDELLANNKYLRAVGDCTTIGSLKCGYYMDHVKNAFRCTFQSGMGRCEFVKTPELGKLRDVFRKLLFPKKGFYFPFFSDDSCAGFRCLDGTLVANLDISACDGSNYRPVFNLLREAMSVDPRFDEDVQGAFEQLCAVAKITDPTDYKNKVFIKPKGPVLYSGSVLTTSVNNMANTLIFLAIADAWRPTMTKAQTIVCVRQAAERVGFILKVDVCSCMGDVQFLKHSPCVNDKGSIDAILNLGVLFRGFGTVVRDLPGKTKTGLEKRADVFNSEVVRGWVHIGEHQVHDAFKTKIIKTRSSKPVSQGWLVDNVTGRQLGRISGGELTRRYRLPPSMLDELTGMIVDSKVGDFICHPALDVILSKDYGY